MDLRTVLLIDDDPDSQEICTTILRHHGFTIVTALDGEEGVRLARERRPDVILMDVTLPGVDGWTATEWLKRDPATSAIPVIMLTARAMAEDHAQGRMAGCDSYLTKPCSPRLVLAEVQRLMKGEG